ncbi:hypothetical protein KP509_37G042800 [Ceratopteris richardii]|nr:hypothetical protein KP509_37G042800 [Ceratopteris richardii]
MKQTDSPDLDGTVDLGWASVPNLDNATEKFQLSDSQQEEVEFNDMESEQCFRPCVYEEFNTWTPVLHPPHRSDEAPKFHIKWGADDKVTESRNRRSDDIAKSIDSGIHNILSPSVNLIGTDTDRSANDDLSTLNEMWASIHIPSAPPFPGNTNRNAAVLSSVLDADAPQWVPDSAYRGCMQCHSKFQAFTRGRHHCRFCGGIFCRSCSKRKCLLPLKFMQRDPQRVCDACYESLEPVQGFLIAVNSNASQIAVHDVTDSTCMRGWVNSPIGLTLQDEIYKATNTLRNFSKLGSITSEQRIPETILKGAKGLAILTVMKVGMVLTYKAGTGLLIARRNDGSWSPPAAIMSCGLGWGLQVGGEIVDFIIILRSTKAVKAFSSRVHISVGAGVSASMGPLGRLAEADIRVGEKGTATCYTYSCSQGAFVGASFEGNVVMPREEANKCFYGDMYVTPDYILFGSLPIPKAAAPLYKALHDLFQLHGPNV